MHKFIYLIVLIFGFFYINKIPLIKASTTFIDSFSGGYDHDLWLIRPSYLEPTSSSFGLIDNYSTNWAILDSKTTIVPQSSIVKFDMKINTTPSDVIFSCKTDFTNDLNFFNDHDLRVYLHADGNASFDSFIDGGGWGGELFTWDKSTGIHSFELNCTNGVMTLKEDNLILSTISTNRDFNTAEHVYFGYRFGDSEFANYQLCSNDNCNGSPTITVTLTSTPILTPTPLLTPSPTPTSTPAPSAPRKIIVVPGFGGSWNRDALLNCKANNYSGDWSNWTIANADIYQPLLKNLENSGFNPLLFYYDWRKQVIDTVPYLSNFIEYNLGSSETVDLVGHSLGGLVGRAYLENAQADSHLSKLLTLGSPHQGSAIVYPAWSGGTIWNNDIQFRLAATMMQVGCMLRNGWSARETIRRVFPTIQNILPTFDYLADSKTHTLKPVSLMDAKNNWQPTSFNSPFFGVTVGAITGTGIDTLKQIEVSSPSKTDIRERNWLDGKPTNNNQYGNGDGTVLAMSSQLDGAENISLPLSHGGLVTDQTGINAIINFLSNQNTTQSISLTNFRQIKKAVKPTKNTSALVIVVEGARATLIDNDGNRIQDSEGQITILDPHEEAYTLNLEDFTRSWRWPWWKPQYRIIVVQLFEDGTSTWKEYSHKGFFAKKWKIRFDRKFKKADIFHDR
jgi:pimeloyl-ACP methyl ester carboxylesterase